jgi:hypothetical protein
MEYGWQNPNFQCPQPSEISIILDIRISQKDGK